MMKKVIKIIYVNFYIAYKKGKNIKVMLQQTTIRYCIVIKKQSYIFLMCDGLNSFFLCIDHFINSNITLSHLDI